MAGRLFGTDGVRGRVGDLVTPSLAARIGDALVRHGGIAAPRVLVIRDTRESGPALARALAAGAAGAGAAVTDGGVLPTPAAPLFLTQGRFDLAAVVSASHNPYEDNGIKLFGPGGFKIGDVQETAIEAAVLEGAPVAEDASDAVAVTNALGADYVETLRERFAGLDLTGRRFGLDCAHGATFAVAPAVFRALGAVVEVIGDAPDGRNINAGVGSTHPEPLQQLVAERGLEAGFAFDGDGDRLIAIGADGRIVDGDMLIALMALSLHAGGRLTGDGVAVTVMSNLGFHRAMETAGIAVATTAVGDRHVLEELRARGWRLGGEQSGHIIDLDLVPSGDGIGSALLVLEALDGAPLHEARPMERFPQVLRNVPVRDRGAVLDDPEIAAAIEAEERLLGADGRLLVRPSGTEQLVRVMAEATTEDEAAAVCERIAGLIAERHGG